jgi:hypothetical protein
VSYTISFDRVGRNHNVPDLLTECTHADDIADQVWHLARNLCGSRDLKVVVDLEEMKGRIFAGVQSAGKFTVTETPAGAR